MSGGGAEVEDCGDAGVGVSGGGSAAGSDPCSSAAAEPCVSETSSLSSSAARQEHMLFPARRFDLKANTYE